MAFTVEDGTIVPGANSYQTVAAFRSYWADRGVTFLQDDPTLQGALVVVTQYVDSQFGECYKGELTDPANQDLCWPRTGATDGKGRTIGPNEMPNDLLFAINEYGKRQLETVDDGGIQPDPGDEGEVIRQKDKVDVLETETQWAQGSGGYFGIRRYPMADNILKGILTCFPGALSTVVGCG